MKIRVTGCRLASGRVVCCAGAAILLSALWLSAGASVAAAATVQEQGYIPMADGTQLAYTVELPSPTGRFPVAMAYAGYCEGTTVTCNDATNATALLSAGYAVL